MLNNLNIYKIRSHGNPQVLEWYIYNILDNLLEFSFNYLLAGSQADFVEEFKDINSILGLGVGSMDYILREVQRLGAQLA